MPEMTAIAERLAEAERLVLQLPCRCINLGDGEYVECDRCRFLHFPEFTQGAAADRGSADDPDACAHPSSVKQADGSWICEWCGDRHTDSASHATDCDVEMDRCTCGAAVTVTAVQEKP
jgi:hypothetical protein